MTPDSDEARLGESKSQTLRRNHDTQPKTVRVLRPVGSSDQSNLNSSSFYSSVKALKLDIPFLDLMLQHEFMGFSALHEPIRVA